MQITISGHQVSLGASFTEYAEDALEKTVKKYFDKAVSAEITAEKRRAFFAVTITVNEGTGNKMIIKGQAEATDIYPAFDDALARIEKQLRRYKRKIKDHHKVAAKENTAELFNATKYVLNNEEEKEEAEDQMPAIIAEKNTAVETLTVSDAVMRMHLADLPALVFINKLNNNLSVVYARKDGNISWVDTQVSK